MRPYIFALATLLALGLTPAADAARDPAPVVPAAHGLRLVVITAPGCIYCSVFRRDIEPSYERSQHAGIIPLEYIDVNEAAADALHLHSPINIVPTIVLVDGNNELGRINGYLSRHDFFVAIRNMLAQQ